MKSRIIGFSIVLCTVSISPVPAIEGRHSGVVKLFSGPEAVDTCALLADARLVCWGYYNYHAEPHDVGGIDVVQASVGKAFGCAVTRDGRVSCWGYVNDNGQLGTPPPNAHYRALPVQYSGNDFDEVKMVSAGSQHVCAIRTDGSAWCWGSNEFGQLGNLDIGIGTKVYAQPIQVRVRDDSTTPPNPILTNLIDISAGERHSCALLRDNSAACWGYDYEGELGNNKTRTNFDSPQTVLVEGTSGLEPLILGGSAIVAGGFHVCGLVSDIISNSVGCWGNNANGQLGTNSKINEPIAYPAQDEKGKIVDATSVAAGEYFTCAILVDGTARCWGYNYHDSLANPSVPLNANQLSGVQVQMGSGAALGNIIDLVAGANHACAMLSSNEIYCWGNNEYDQILGFSEDFTSVPQHVLIDAPLFTDNFDGN